MALVVQKYGGSSVADADCVKRVAQRIVATKKAGNDVVVVVSAMGDTTDELIDLAQKVSPLPPARELDMLLTAGERISMAVLAMAIANLGHEAKSFTGSQAGVITDGSHGKAKIIDVTPTVLYLMGLPIPDDMDGKVLVEAIDPEFLVANPIRYESTEDGAVSEVDNAPHGFSKDESEMIARRLQALGYIQ